MNTPESDQTVDGTSKFSLDYFNLLVNYSTLSLMNLASW